MYRFIKVFIPVLLGWSYTCAQIIPWPGARLNYTQVMFEHSTVPGADEYILQLFSGKDTDDFSHPIAECRDSSTATLISDLTFGQKYYWRYAGIRKGRFLNWHGPYNFEILNYPFLNQYRVRVIQNDSLKNALGLISIDAIRTIVDREGKPVLFVPFAHGFRENAAVDDLRLTKYGTLCSLGGQNAIETDLAGNITWMTPLKTRNAATRDFGDFYNHDFKRLDNGNYMVIGGDYQWKTIPEYYYIYDLLHDKRGVKLPDSMACKNGTLYLQNGYTIKINNDKRELYINMASICEYDKHDDLVWSWNPVNYIQDTDLFPPDRDWKLPIAAEEPHVNGFSVDDKNEYVYVSFRNLSRVVKVDKKTGKVVDSWGAKMASGEARQGNGFFHLQHCPSILKNGNISVYDNGDTSVHKGFSTVTVFSQPTRLHHKSKIVWQFVCKFDTSSYGKSHRGGNVDQLYNDDFLVCQGAINRIFEVNHKKYVSWQGLVEKRNKNDTAWQPEPLYRAHYTSSLYPCYFTAQTDTNTFSGGEASFKLKIFNKGSEDDSYTVKISQGCSEEDMELKAGELRPGKSEGLNIRLPGPPQESENVVVTVTSNTNHDLQKSVVMQWMR